MSTIFERLRSERVRIGESQASFAEIGGVQRRAQANYETGERSPDAIYLEKIASAGADISFIITGKRSFPVDGENNAKENLNIDIFDNTFERKIGSLNLSSLWLSQHQLEPGNVKGSVLVGDLMQPVLNNGETFIYNTADKNLVSGKAYIIRLLEQKTTLIGYVQMLPNGGVRLAFENKNYPPIELTKDDLENISVMGSLVLSLREW